MNRYPLWKYILIAVLLAIGFLYTVPNFYGESPAVQVSSAKVTVKVDASMTQRIEAAWQQAGVKADFVQFDGNSVKARFSDTDTQLKARDAITKALNPDAADPSYIVALNLVSRSPDWLTAIGAKPMYLGLDLRGGVHFLLEVDMEAALSQRLEVNASAIRELLRSERIRHRNHVIGILRVCERKAKRTARGASTDAGAIAKRIGGGRGDERTDVQDAQSCQRRFRRLARGLARFHHAIGPFFVDTRPQAEERTWRRSADQTF